MTQFVVDISDSHQLAGITAARNDYNQANASDPAFVPLATDQEYVQYVMQSAAQSYAVHYGT